MRRYKIALITGSPRPIPQTQGGATQTMMTHVLDENEIHNKMQIDVFSYFEPNAEKKSQKYCNSKFFYYKPRKTVDYLYTFFFRFLRKLTRGKSYIRTNYVKFCIEQIKKDNYDAVLIEGNYFQVLQFRKALNNKLILHMHIDELRPETDNAKRIVDACSGIFAISDYCRANINKIDETCVQKTFTLKNTIDTEHFIRNENERKNIREKYNIKEGQTVFAFCGRICEQKGALELVQAFSEVAKNSNAVLMIIGSSVYLNGKPTKYTQKVHNAVASIKDKVIFTGFIPQERLPSYYSAADVLVVPSILREAAGNITIEGMATDLPIIAAKNGGIPEYADERASVLVDVNDNFVQNLTKAMSLLLENEDKRISMSKQARNCALVYHKSNYYNNLCGLIDRILNEE